MKISVHQKPELEETEVLIRCREIDSQITEIVSILGGVGQQITGSKNGRFYFVERADILYIEAVERRTFLYMEKEVLESSLRLYELEEMLQGANFIRASKSTLVNLKKVHSLEPSFGGRMEAVMDNRERVVFSRQYTTALKQKIKLR